jgi:hypothetical protein
MQGMSDMSLLRAFFNPHNSTARLMLGQICAKIRHSAAANAQGMGQHVKPCRITLGLADALAPRLL